MWKHYFLIATVTKLSKYNDSFYFAVREVEIQRGTDL